MKKLIVVGVVAGLLGLAGAGKVEAQCPPNGGIAVNPTNYRLLMPSDVPGVTATIVVTVANVSGAFPSHSVTITPGTQVVWSWTSTNGVAGNSVQLSYYVDGIFSYTTSNVPLQGSNQTGWTMDASNVGHYYQVVFSVPDAHGNTTLDRFSVMVVAGSGASIVNQDEIPSNLYYEAVASFSGTSSMACGACQQNPQACSNVTHEGRISFELDNLTSGETQIQPMIYGPLVNPTFNNGLTSNPLYLSELPGDTTQDSQTDQVECSLIDGLFYNESPIDSGTGKTFKIMKTKIKIAQQGSTTNGVTRWYVDSWCQDTQHTPIWEPLYIDTKGWITPLIKVGQYEISDQDCWAEPGWPAWECPPITVTPPQPLHIGVGGTKYDCSTLINTPLPQ